MAFWLAVVLVYACFSAYLSKVKWKPCRSILGFVFMCVFTSFNICLIFPHEPRYGWCSLAG